MTDLRTLERDSIRAFVQSAADDGYLSGRVLDYGCGKQPYRDIVEAAGGEYVGFDRTGYPANVSGEDIGELPGWDVRWDAILCTQVIQYVSLCHETDVCNGMPNFLHDLHSLLEYMEPGQEPPRKITSTGHLVLTYPTNWPEVEPEDLHRFTKAGMERLLTETGFEVLVHERRETFWGIDNYKMIGETWPDEFALGYGVICRA